MRVTIKDVAREAGVSISTVSNALNGVDVLHPDTKAHILQIAEKMHYIPNQNGRNLKAHATGNIGLFVSYLGGPYAGALADSMVKECNNTGYELNIFVTGKENSIMKNILGQRIDGAVILNSTLSAKQENEIALYGIPVVYLNKKIHGTNQSGVYFDSYKAGKMAAEFLLEKGLTELSLIEGANNYDGKERSRGFKDTLSEHHVSLKAEYLFQGNFSRDKTRETMLAFLKKKGSTGTLPQAVFACNDLSAIGCMEALQSMNVDIPETVKLIGCDDIELCKYMHPTLSTIRTNFEEQGAEAVKSVIRMIKEDHNGTEICLSSKIVERESTRM